MFSIWRKVSQITWEWFPFENFPSPSVVSKSSWYFSPNFALSICLYETFRNARYPIYCTGLTKIIQHTAEMCSISSQWLNISHLDVPTRARKSFFSKALSDGAVMNNARNLTFYSTTNWKNKTRIPGPYHKKLRSSLFLEIFQIMKISMYIY